MSKIENGFSLKYDLSEKQIEELIDYSNNDELIAKFTQDSERFANRDAYNSWRSKGRSIYVFESDEGSLAGLIWFGKEKCPIDLYQDCENTFAIRLYGDFRGKGLAGKMVEAAITDYFDSGIGEEVGVWLKVSEDNMAARRLYESFGFERVSEPDEEGKIILIRAVERDEK